MGNFIDLFLKCRTFENTDYYNVKGNFRAKIVEIHKGDCVSIIIFNNFKFEKHKIVMGDYYIADISKNTNNFYKMKQMEKIENAKKFLKEKILNKIVDIEIIGSDRGVLMGNVTFEKKELGEIMINNNLGYPFLFR
jgi:hypothetical protein